MTTYNITDLTAPVGKDDAEHIFTRQVLYIDQMLSRAGSYMAASEELTRRREQSTEREERVYAESLAIEALQANSVITAFAAFEGSGCGPTGKDLYERLKNRTDIAEWKCVRNRHIAHGAPKNPSVKLRRGPGIGAIEQKSGSPGIRERMAVKGREWIELINEALRELQGLYTEVQEKEGRGPYGYISPAGWGWGEENHETPTRETEETKPWPFAENTEYRREFDLGVTRRKLDRERTF